MFIRFMNDAPDGVNRMYIEKLGISTKRNDSRTIGQFGSGSKLAPIAALRRGMRWVVAGSDNNGDYVMEYKIVEEDGFNHIFFDYGTHMKETSYTADAGVLGWNYPFQIFREAYANMYDAYLEFGASYSVDLVDEVTHIPGKFATYITANEDMLDIYRNMDRWFSIGRDPIYVGDGFKLYSPTYGVVYSKGVNVSYSNSSAVFNTEQMMFDYEFDDVSLNEERVLVGFWDVACKSAAAILAIKDGALFSQTMDSLRKKDSSLETTYCLGPHSLEKDDLKNFQKMWDDTYGENCGVISAAMIPSMKTAMALRNMKYVGVNNDFLIATLVNCGIASISALMDSPLNLDYIEGSLIERHNLAKAIEIIRKWETVVDHFEFRIFQPRKDQSVHGLIFEEDGKNVIAISSVTLKSIEEAIATLVHEIDHHITGMDDIPEFRTIADNRIAQLMLFIEDIRR